MKALFAAIQGAGLVGAKGATVVNGVLGDPHFLLHQTLRELVVGEGKHTGLQQQELGLVVARLGDGFSLAGHLWGAANRQTKQEVEEDPGKETTKTKKKKKEAHGC